MRRVILVVLVLTVCSTQTASAQVPAPVVRELQTLLAQRALSSAVLSKPAYQWLTAASTLEMQTLATELAPGLRMEVSSVELMLGRAAHLRGNSNGAGSLDCAGCSTSVPKQLIAAIDDAAWAAATTPSWAAALEGGEIVRSVQLAPGQIVGDTDAVQRRISMHGRSLGELAAHMQAIRRGLGPEIRLEDVRRVVYPMAGDDVLSPLQLFPNAEVVVLLDGHPFAHPSVFEGAAIALREVSGHAWVNFRDLDSLAYTSRSILPSLRTQFPELTDLEVRVFETPYRYQDARNALRDARGGEDIKNADYDPIYVANNHGVITFRPSPGEPVKTIIVLNTSVPREAGQSWWIPFLRDLRPDGVMTKGSQDGLVFAGSRARAVGHEGPTAFAAELEQLVAAQGGVALEGTHEFEPVWELLPETPSFPHQSVVLEDVPFGYGNRIRATRFRE